MGEESFDKPVDAGHLMRYRQRSEQLERENRQLRRELSQHLRSETSARELAILKEVSNAIVSELDLSRVLVLVADKAREIIAADTVLVPMLSDDRREYRYVAASGKNADEILNTRLPIHVGMCGWVLTHETPLLFGHDAPFALDESTQWEKGQASALLVPLFGKNRIIGGISALGKAGGASFTKTDLDLITLFANQVSIAIENASLVEELRNTLDTLEQRIQARTAELTEINRELESFCYSASHDLRSPLRGIDGFSQILMDDYPQLLDEPARDYLERIRAASQRMGQIIDDLLRLSQVVRKSMRWEPVDLSAMAQRLVNRYRSQTPARAVSVKLAPDLHCDGDAELLEMALDNLLGNAWKFTQNVAQPSIEFGSRREEGETALFVCDNGCGFDMQYQGKLFQPFQRLHRQEEYPGCGVGLAIAERIVKRHGGRLWAVSAPGKGATFLFTLPAPRAPG
jgi:signal transduction histidine kinase